MADTPKVLDKDRLTYYDKKIKEYIGNKAKEPDGSSIVYENNLLSLNPEYTAYLDEVTYKKPSVVSFGVTSISTSVWVGESVNPTGFTHYESNLDNISGTLTLSKGSTTVRSGISASSSTATVTFTDTEKTNAAHTFTSNASIMYKLSGTNSKGTAFYKTVSVTACYPFYIGSSTAESLTAAEIVKLTRQSKKSGVSGTYTVTLASDAYIYLCCQSGFTVNKVTSGGFESPFTQLSNVNGVTINGVSCTYKSYRTPEMIGAGTYELVIS